MNNYNIKYDTNTNKNENITSNIISRIKEYEDNLYEKTVHNRY